APPEDGRLPDASVSPTDVAFIGFTSGSTGEPKPIRTSHEALYRSTEAAQHLFAFGPDDIFCTSTAFSALSAFRSLVTLPFLSGGRVMIPSAEARHHPLALALECQTFGVTRLTAVPNVLRGLVKAEARLPHGCLSSLKTAFSGSGVLDQPTARMFRSTFGVDVVDYYGGREFATACYSEPDADDTMSAGGGMVSNALACLVDHAHIPVPVGGIGEIVVHSDCLTLSELPSISDEGPWAGWHFTGDLGRRMEDGRLEIVGRRKDIVKTQDGELVNPAEVEGFLNEMPEILEACVFGWSGDDAVERLAAAVLLSNTIDQGFEDRARAHILEIAGSYKVPSHVFAMDTLPRVAQNKPDKIALKEHFLKTILKQAF
ncbi:MAG: class I adenylate-forming enzyme family protein, partial [Pseudomonadota bacterium]